MPQPKLDFLFVCLFIVEIDQSGFWYVAVTRFWLVKDIESKAIFST